MIVVEKLTKTFRLYRRPSDRLRELILRRAFHHVHHVLDDVSFAVKDGETLGIIGCNGAGKSTLLKILTGVLLPDSGRTQVSGRATGLLELGTGFNLELTGLENIRANALLLGMTAARAKNRESAIIEFAELGEFIAEPIKTYSSGMIMRLAFAIAIHADPACFVVDEALAVGDAYFQQKCMGALQRFRNKGGSIVFVSHDLNAIKLLCDKVLVLDNGRVVGYDKPEPATNLYNRIIARVQQDAERKHEETPPEPTEYGSGRAWIERARIVGSASAGNVMSAGETAEIWVDYLVREAVDDLTLGFMIRDRFGQDIFGTNTSLFNQTLNPPLGVPQTACWQVVLNIAPGHYTVTLGLHRRAESGVEVLHWHDSVLRFEIAGIQGLAFGGVCRLETKFFTGPTKPVAKNDQPGVQA
ncbi:ABC transporter ATP-binding protein [Thiorhodovibrio frisius]|uniref:ABC-type polysaccharide/polyol phosphate transport system, ATPase component n=1 Tax=Thiorhodovibrio frisius TaxID=631362 RepID=H8Z1T5_9GAMM|nr:Wzt carbohydrate-binding domain-containing protein [Thiorhodovibrio frisius]EIC22563.1 ABC-type polysaccharide/polyol phosphate transport system, ATPase component [Thiorhodovibrio frisius]WPL20004.1 Teichoic acids export ATP-binding protein TagH [Thiorhodovibrio frisius]